MKGFLTILKKELTRFFKDKKLIFTMIFPGILIYVLYSIMGTFMTNVIADNVETAMNFNILTVNRSVELENLAEKQFQFIDGEIVFTESDMTDKEAKEAVKAGDYDAYIVFPENFDELVKEQQKPVPHVSIYYNSVEQSSATAYQFLISLLDEYESKLANRFDVNTAFDRYDVGEEADVMGMVYAMIVPMLLMMFAVTGAVSVTPESIAGEKERGTIATILVTPVKRWQIALGKITALSIESMISMIATFFGTMLALPKLMGGVGEMAEIETNIFAIFGADKIVALLFVLLTYIPLIVGILSIMSTLSKSVKEATSVSSIVMIVSMLFGVGTMMNLGSPIWMAFVPFLNTATAISGVLNASVATSFLALSIVANIAYTAIIVFVLAKLFDSEKIML